jgi:hypothetical protein
MKAILLIDIADDLFPQLAEILTQHLTKYGANSFDIEIVLAEFLTNISRSSSVTKDPLTIAAKRRVV